MSVSSAFAPVDPLLYPTVTHSTLSDEWMFATACPVGLTALQRPVSTDCGHAFSLKSLQPVCKLTLQMNGDYLASSNSACPLCTKNIVRCMPNEALKEVISFGTKILGFHETLSRAHQALLKPDSSTAPLEVSHGTQAELICTRPLETVTEEEMTQDSNLAVCTEFKYTTNTPDASLVCARVYGFQGGGIEVRLFFQDKEKISEFLARFGCTLDPSGEGRTMKNSQGESVPIGLFIARTRDEIALACKLVLANANLSVEDEDLFECLADTPWAWELGCELDRAVKSYEIYSEKKDPCITSCGHLISRDELTSLCGPIIEENGRLKVSKLGVCSGCEATITDVVVDYALKDVIEKVKGIVEDYWKLAERHRNLLVRRLLDKANPPAVVHVQEAASQACKPKKGAPVSELLPPFPGARAQYIRHRFWLGPTEKERVDYPGLKRRVAYKTNTPGALISYVRVSAFSEGSTEWFFSSEDAEGFGQFADRFGWKLSETGKVRMNAKKPGQKMGVLVLKEPADIALAYKMLVKNNELPQEDLSFLGDLAQNPTNWLEVEKNHPTFKAFASSHYFVQELEEREKEKEAARAKAAEQKA